MTSTTINRRAITRGLAWGVPTIALATAAPSFAVSPTCLKPVTVDWSSAYYRRESDRKGVYQTADPDGAGPQVPLTITVQTVSVGSNTQTGNQNRDVLENLVAMPGIIGGQPRPLSIHQSPKDDTYKTDTLSSANLTVTRISFSRPVQELGFTISDIDSHEYDFWDAVAIKSDSIYSHTINDRTMVTGTGSVNNPWTATSNHTSIPDASTKGNVTVRFGSVTSFDIYYWNRTADYADIDGDQRIFISNLSVVYNACP